MNNQYYVTGFTGEIGGCRGHVVWGFEKVAL
jgi:hypothetical protein